MSTDKTKCDCGLGQQGHVGEHLSGCPAELAEKGTPEICPRCGSEKLKGYPCEECTRRPEPKPATEPAQPREWWIAILPGNDQKVVAPEYVDEFSRRNPEVEIVQVVEASRLTEAEKIMREKDAHRDHLLNKLTVAAEDKHDLGESLHKANTEKDAWRSAALRLREEANDAKALGMLGFLNDALAEFDAFVARQK